MDVWTSLGSFVLGVLATFTGFLIQEKVRIWQLRKSVANAMLAEARSVRDHHMQVIGNHIDQTPDHSLPTQRIVMRDQHPFPLFERLSQHLGIFPPEHAGRLAHLYTEASSFAHSLRAFMDRMTRIDELTIAIHSADSVADVRTATALRTQLQILQNSQIQFFAYIKSQQRRVTGDLFQEVTAILARYT